MTAMIAWRRVVVRIALCFFAAAAGASCGSACGLGLHDRVTVSAPPFVPCCGGFIFKDVSLSGNGKSEFDLSNVGVPSVPGLVDAFLVPTSCAKLFDGSYPGAAPLCQVYSGPATPGHVSSRVALAAGTYRLWLQAYTSNESDGHYFVDIGIWDHSCRSPLQ